MALFTKNWFLFKKKKDFDIYNVFIITIRKRPAPKRELKEEDVTRHLVFAFNGFLDRQGKKEPVDEEKVKIYIYFFIIKYLVNIFIEI